MTDVFVWDIQQLLLAPDAKPTKAEFDRLYTEANEARQRFHLVARQSLDVF